MIKKVEGIAQKNCNMVEKNMMQISKVAFEERRDLMHFME